MTLALFDCPDSTPLPSDTPTSIATPLGTLGYEAIIDEVDVCGLAPSAAFRTPSDGHLFRWLIDQFQAELLLAPITPTLPEGMHVDGCWVGVWRVKASVDIENVQFHCEWKRDYTWTDGSGESGEWLDAQTWEDGRVQVTVGTDDPMALADRATIGDWLPMRWGERLGYTALSADGRDRINPVVYTPQGLRLALPEMQRDELCQVHFIVAWCPAPPTPEEARTVSLYESSWFAVDQSIGVVLEGVGCR